MSELLSLFDEPKEQDVVTFSPVVMRNYQLQQARSVANLWLTFQAVLLVSSVGSGKTTTFSYIASDRIDMGRVLVLAHRSELVTQAYKRLKLFGIEPAIDKAQERATHGHFARACVVGTVQTVIARLNYYDPFDFSTVIIDEGHHSVAASYQRIIAHFKQNPECKILGVTGTPDRGDERALSMAFDAVAEPVFGITRAIDEGWLVKPKQEFVVVEGLDISRVRTTAGDLNAADMAEILESKEILGKMHVAVVDRVGEMSTLIFAMTVNEAELLTEIFNEAREGCAACVTGKTPPEDRAKMFGDFERGAIQFLINVGVATEGTDMPHVRCIVNARMTKSRALYEQINGRGARPEPGCVDGIDTPEERRAAIAASSKPDFLMLDFVGNSGKHKLITVVDILGGDITPEVKSAVNARIRKSGKPADVIQEIEKVKEEFRKKAERKARDRDRRRQVQITGVNYSTREVDPFDPMDRFGEQDRNDPMKPSPAQCYYLKSHGHKNPERYTKAQASAIIGKIKSGSTEQQLSEKQNGILKRFKYDISKMSVAEARAEIDAIAKNGWRPL